MAHYVIGDLQGCLTPFKNLLNKIKFNPDRDQIWLTGDLVNRGPESLETLEFVYDRREVIRTVLGNHDIMLLAVAMGGLVTTHNCHPILELGNTKRKHQLLDWLLTQPLLWQEKIQNQFYSMVHAGIHPNWTNHDIKLFSQEVSKFLQNQVFSDWKLLFDPSFESDIKSKIDIFTRMRYLNRENFLEFKVKASLSDTLTQNQQEKNPLKPWFERLDPSFQEQIILFGHWSSLEEIEIINNNNQKLYALDTGCVWGRALTALKLETLELIQVPGI